VRCAAGSASGVVRHQQHSPIILLLHAGRRRGMLEDRQGAAPAAAAQVAADTPGAHPGLVKAVPGRDCCMRVACRLLTAREGAPAARGPWGHQHTTSWWNAVGPVGSGWGGAARVCAAGAAGICCTLWRAHRAGLLLTGHLCWLLQRAGPRAAAWPYKHSSTLHCQLEPAHNLYAAAQEFVAIQAQKARSLWKNRLDGCCIAPTWSLRTVRRSHKQVYYFEHQCVAPTHLSQWKKFACHWTVPRRGS
jgi:hypothetical protein